MKKFIFLVVLFLGFYQISALGQGQLNFFTFNLDTSKGRISDVSFGCCTLAGPDHWGQVLGGTTPESLTPIGVPTQFLLGGGQPSGILNGGIVTVDGIPPGAEYFVAVAAWLGGTGSDFYSAAKAGHAGISETLRITLGGIPADGGDPFPIPQINEFSNYVFPVPEPGSRALMIVGGLFVLGLGWKGRGTGAAPYVGGCVGGEARGHGTGAAPYVSGCVGGEAPGQG